VNARDEVLARIKSAITPAAVVTTPRDYRLAGDGEAGSAQVIDRLVERLTDYKARVHRIEPAALPDTLGQILAGGGPVVVPPGLPAQWREACAAQDRPVQIDGEPVVLTAAALDEVAAVVTACRVAIAETGTVVLDGGRGQGRRALTLITRHHLCVVHADQIVGTVPEAVGRLDPYPPLSWISGPSEGRSLEILVVED
jgi:L-lactate dehydrogenase complex protein LldG